MTDVNAQMEALRAELAAAQAENDTLKTKQTSKISMKVSQKGAVSVYGLQRFPVTLYANQFERLLGVADDIRAFIADNAATLSVKD